MGERHFRAHARPEIRARVRWRRLDVPLAREVDAFTRNIGVGGAFILTDVPPPVGALVELSLVSPSTWEPLRVRAEVRWSSLDDPPGMGVSFRDLQPRDVVALHDFFVSLHFA